MRFYMDTARLGQACPASMQVQCEFAGLAAYDPSFCSIGFLKDGASDWPSSLRSEFPTLSEWQGLAHLKRLFAAAVGVEDSQRVFLANQTARLVRIAARAMARQCHRVMTTDLNWPAWQSIVADEAARHGREIKQIAISDSVMQHGWTANDIVNHLATTYCENRCDGLFLPAVSSLGITVPVAQLVASLRRQSEVRFVLVDAAQAFGQVSLESITASCDVLVTGCHKWLGAHLPMGVAVAGNSLAAKQFRCVVSGRDASLLCSDPLLMLTEQLQADEVNRYAETVSIVPMLAANAALSSGQADPVITEQEFAQRLNNLDEAAACLSDSSWCPVSLNQTTRSAIMLATANHASVRQAAPDTLQTHFRNHGIALSAYQGGLLRLSMPSGILQQNYLEFLSSAFQTVSHECRSM